MRKLGVLLKRSELSSEPMLDNQDEIIFSAMGLISLYERYKGKIPDKHRTGLDDAIERLKRDLARVNDGSRPELILSVKMGTLTLRGALDFIWNTNE